MPKLPTLKPSVDLFLHNRPLIDLRAPSEFVRGSVPGAISLPLMSDEERAQVGLCYKEKGQEAAITLGHALVSGAIKDSRLEAWQAAIKAQPETALFCFRGGLRSHITQRWLAEAGVSVPLVTGGYKALRRLLIDQLTAIMTSHNSVIIGGRTGSNKTVLVNKLATGIDLEGLANHRGSSFGRPIDDVQPQPINFENNLALALMRCAADHGPAATLFFEDESARIGSLSLPEPVIEKIRSQPLVVVEEPLDFRITIISRDYISARLDEFLLLDPNRGFAAFRDYLLSALTRLKKRLGGARFSQLHGLMTAALDVHEKTGDDSSHRNWISPLLVDYYDPMYDYQLDKKANPIAARGSGADMVKWCEENS